MTKDPYRDSPVKMTGPEPFGARLLATLKLWSSTIYGVVVLTVTLGFMFLVAWDMETHEDRECAKACDAIQMPRSVDRDGTCYCADETGKAWPWPDRPRPIDSCDPEIAEWIQRTPRVLQCFQTTGSDAP